MTIEVSEITVANRIRLLQKLGKWKVPVTHDTIRAYLKRYGQGNNHHLAKKTMYAMVAELLGAQIDGQSISGSIRISPLTHFHGPFRKQRPE